MNYNQITKMLQTAIKYADNAEERAVYIHELELMDRRKQLDVSYNDCGYIIIPSETVVDLANNDVYDIYGELYVSKDGSEPSAYELSNQLNKISSVYVMPEDVDHVTDFIAALYKDNEADHRHDAKGHIKRFTELIVNKKPTVDYDTLSSAVTYLHRYMDCNRECMDADDLGNLAVTLKNLVTMMTECL